MTTVKNDTSVSIFKLALAEWIGAPPEDREAVLDVLRAYSVARRKEISAATSEQKFNELCKGTNALCAAIDLLGNSQGIGDLVIDTEVWL